MKKLLLLAFFTISTIACKENQKVYTVDFIAESQEFTETKNTVEARQNRDEGEVPFK